MVIKSKGSLIIDEVEVFREPFLNIDVHRRKAVFRCKINDEGDDGIADRKIGYDMRFEPAKLSILNQSTSMNFQGKNAMTNVPFAMNLSIGLKTNGIVLSGTVNGKRVNQNIGYNILTLINILEG